MDTPCKCEQPGHCPRFNRQMVGRMYQICRGEVLTPEKCEAYRWMWDREAGKQVPEREPVPCRHRGEEVGRVQCQSCSGQVLVKKFACQYFGGECEIGNLIEGVRSCKLCMQRE